MPVRRATLLNTAAIHRMALQQNCECVDTSNAVVRPELVEEIEKRNNRKEKINLDLIQQIARYKIMYDPSFKK